MVKISPEFRDPLDMEIWYKAIGDDYALWLMKQVEDYNALLENDNETLCKIADKHSDYQDDFEELEERITTLSERIGEVLYRSDVTVKDAAIIIDNLVNELQEFITGKVEDLSSRYSDIDELLEQ